MLVKDYMTILGEKFPGVQAHIIGDPSIYENIVLEEGSNPLPSKETLDNVALDIARTDMWRKIQYERDIRKSGGVQVGANWFHSDDTSRIQQIALTMLGANMPPNIMWKTMQGTFVTMTPQLAMGIFQSIMLQDQKIFAHAEYHRQRMITTEPENPYAYNYDAGWPTTYAEWAVAQTPPAPPPAPGPSDEPIP